MFEIYTDLAARAKIYSKLKGKINRDLMSDETIPKILTNKAEKKLTSKLT